MTEIAPPLSSSPRPAAADFERGVVNLIACRGRDAKGSTKRPSPSRPASPPKPASKPKNAPAPLSAHRVQSREEHDAARRLVGQRYAWRGYGMPPAPVRRAGTSVPHEITFVATADADTVGTLTLGLDGRAGLRAERTHGDAIAERRAAGANVCELTQLAVAERADSRSVLAALFNVAYEAGSAHGITDVFIEVNPRHVSFYTRVLGFAVAAAEKFCERVQAPSVLLSLAIEELERRLYELDRMIAPARSFAARAA